MMGALQLAAALLLAAPAHSFISLPLLRSTTLLKGLHTDKPFSNPDHDLLVRVARGEKGERTPVWLMRQAGRYMAGFRQYSDKYAFRERSENPEIAVELSLQCWRAFGMDGVIMFSDILTPLTALGIDFDVVKGKGPVIYNPPRSLADVNALKKLEVKWACLGPWIKCNTKMCHCTCCLTCLEERVTTQPKK